MVKEERTSDGGVRVTASVYYKPTTKVTHDWKELPVTGRQMTRLADIRDCLYNKIEKWKQSSLALPVDDPHIQSIALAHNWIIKYGNRGQAAKLIKCWYASYSIKTWKDYYRKFVKLGKTLRKINLEE